MTDQTLQSYSHPAVRLEAEIASPRKCSVTLYRERLIVCAQHNLQSPLEIYRPILDTDTDYLACDRVGLGVTQFDGKPWIVCDLADTTEKAMQSIDRNAGALTDNLRGIRLKNEADLAWDASEREYKRDMENGAYDPTP